MGTHQKNKTSKVSVWSRIKGYVKHTPKFITVVVVEVGFFIGLRSVINGDPVVTSVVGLALVFYTADKLLR